MVLKEYVKKKKKDAKIPKKFTLIDTVPILCNNNRETKLVLKANKHLQNVAQRSVM